MTLRCAIARPEENSVRGTFVDAAFGGSNCSTARITESMTKSNEANLMARVGFEEEVIIPGTIIGQSSSLMCSLMGEGIFLRLLESSVGLEFSGLTG